MSKNNAYRIALKFLAEKHPDKEIFHGGNEFLERKLKAEIAKYLHEKHLKISSEQIEVIYLCLFSILNDSDGIS